jgi:UDP-N-acetylmuramoyl-tripeptide--D-alanyl-D-alanine ligase
MDNINFKIFELISHLFLTLSLSFYLMTLLQWYNYKINRVLFHSRQYLWHILYFVIPLFAYYLTGKFYWIYFYFAYLPTLYLWHKRLDKKLVFTPRVKRFFIFLALALIFQDLLCLATQKCQVFGVMLPIAVSLMASYFFEAINLSGFKKAAKKKLGDKSELKIVAITASYGKTSTKNYLSQILKKSFRVYATPRSVNTLEGIMKDINEDLPDDCEIYVVEAGARERGDIAKIAELLEHEYAIVGKIGPQHIEYFKSLENIRNTKMELLSSKNLKYALVHKSANVKPDSKVEIFGDSKVVNSTIEGIEFEIEINGKSERFFAPLLGEFNAINLEAAILMALKLGVSLDEIKEAVRNLTPTPHRLQKIEAGGKIIIDDSFNGNFEGMMGSYDLISGFEGRKVIITPGLYEATSEDNEKIAKRIDEVFDVVIITGKQNATTLFANIKNAKKILLKDKNQLELTLAEVTKKGDIVLFSNDAPNFL